MGRVNGKQKGNKFERDIANKLSERFKAFTGIEKSFRRNPDSGSFFGGTNIQRMDIYDTDYALYGDLICPRNFNFSIECKHYKEAPPLNAIMTQKVKQWDDWLSQADQDAKASNKESLMIVKYNRTETMAFLATPLLTLDMILKYKDYCVYRLDTVLEQEDTFFFN
jgi:hypothetical protein